MAGFLTLYRSVEDALRLGLGKRIVKIYRILFKHRDVIEREDGAIEFHFDDGTVLLLEGAGDGETVRVSHEAWRDPFSGTLSEQNRQFIEESGRWVAVDVSMDAFYSGFVGATVSEFAIMENQFGQVSGVELRTAQQQLWFAVEFDESHVYGSAPDGFKLIMRI